jgi:membrane dipeptidase
MPRPIKDASGLQHLIAALLEHGFGATTVRKLALENWLRVFRLSWR